MFKVASKEQKKSLIKAIIFDLGNVLLNYNARRAALRFAKECKVPLVRIWKYFFISPVEKAYTRGEISSYQFYQYAKEGLGLDISYVKFRHFWNDIFWENNGMEPLLKQLKRRYLLYLISNTNKMHFDYIKKNFSILRYFRKSFPSHEVGHRKPSPEIYHHVLKHIGLRPEETVFVDDTPEFVQGARKVGMHAIRFRNRKQLIKDLAHLGVTV